MHCIHINPYCLSLSSRRNADTVFLPFFFDVSCLISYSVSWDSKFEIRGKNKELDDVMALDGNHNGNDDDSRDPPSISCISDDLDTCIQGPTMPYDPPNTPDFMTMPEFVPLPPSPPGAPVSKWRLLVGTPSKPPIPDNIYVPEPSSSSTLPDESVSTALLASSSESSLVVKRRQGEYVKRPPVWKVYRMKDALDSQESVDDFHDDIDCDVKGFGSPLDCCGTYLNYEKPFNQDLGWSMLGFSGDFLGKKLTEMADVVMDGPLTVQMMRDPNMFGRRRPSRIEADLLDPQVEASSNSAEPALSPIAETPINDENVAPPTSNQMRANDGLRRTARDSLEITPAPLSGEGKGKGRASDVIFRRSSRSTNPSMEPSINRSSQEPGVSGSSRDNSYESNTPKIYNTALDPKRYCHFELPKIVKDKDFVDEYLDVRVPPTTVGKFPFRKRISAGSHVTFIGRTEFENSNGRACVVGLPMLSEYYVERIFGDFWALLLKLEPGLEIATKRMNHSFGGLRKLAPPKHLRYETKLIPVKKHPIIAVFAPLCAFTLMSNLGLFQFHMHAPIEPGAKALPFQGGLVKAAPRGSSDTFESDANRNQVVWISERVYHQYEKFCNGAREDHNTLKKKASSTKSFVSVGYEELTAGKSSQQDTTAGSKNTAFQKCRDVFSWKKRQTSDKIHSQEIGQSSKDPNPINPSTNEAQQEQAENPPAVVSGVRLPSFFSAPSNSEGSLLEKIPAKAMPHTGDAESMLIDECTGEDDDPHGFKFPTSHRPELTETDLHSADPGSKGMEFFPNYPETGLAADIKDIEATNNQDSVQQAQQRNSKSSSNPVADQIQADNPRPLRINKDKGKRRKAMTVASRFMSRSWRRTRPIQDPQPGFTQRSLDTTFLFKLPSLLRRHRQTRPSILPQISSNTAGAEPLRAFDESRIDDIVQDPGWDAGIQRKGSVRQRLNNAWRSLRARRPSQTSIITNPYAVEDENRHRSTGIGGKDHRLESNQHYQEQPLLTSDFQVPEAHGSSGPLVLPIAGSQDAGPQITWNGISEEESSHILSQLIREAGPTPDLRERIIAWQRRESDPGFEAAVSAETRQMFRQDLAKRPVTK